MFGLGVSLFYFHCPCSLLFCLWRRPLHSADHWSGKAFQFSHLFICEIPRNPSITETARISIKRNLKKGRRSRSGLWQLVTRPIKAIMRWYRGLCTSLLTAEENSEKPQLGNSHRLKWGPFPPNEVDGIAQYVRKAERTKGQWLWGIVFISFRIGIIGESLWMRHSTSGLHEL